MIRAAVGDLAVQPLHVVAARDKRGREVIQQCRVAGRVCEVLIIRRVDQADVEVPGPDAIDEGASEVRVVFLAYPVHQRLPRIGVLAGDDLFAAEQLGCDDSAEFRIGFRGLGSRGDFLLHWDRDLFEWDDLALFQ